MKDKIYYPTLLEALRLLNSAHDKLAVIPNGLDAQTTILKAMDKVNKLIVSPKVAQEKTR
jgi:hypothetical protein